MAEFKVTLSSLEEASSQLKTEADEYLTAAEELRTAAANLTQGSTWEGDAAQAYDDCVQTLYAWMQEMATVVQGFGTVLTEAREIYDSADQQAKGQFA